MTSGLGRYAYNELTGRIVDASARTAFDALISGMQNLGAFELRPNVNGQKKAIHFSSGRASYFAVIANNSWLLWYFRYPGFRLGMFKLPDLRKQFPELIVPKRKDPTKTEATLRIWNVQQANQVLSYVAKHPAI